MKNIDFTGVYKIVNKINGKIYYGSASVSFKERWYAHRLELRNNTHHCIHLQNAYNFYGEKNFTFEIVLFCDPDECLYYEQQYLDLYWDGGINCYNMSMNTIGNMRGIHHSPEGKASISAGNLGKKKRNNTSGFSGVSFAKDRNKWIAVISYQGRPYHLGRFITAEEANIVYQSALNIIRRGKKLPPRQHKLRPNNKSGFEGVYWCAQKNKWCANITINYKVKHIGFFDKPEKASKAYQDVIKLINDGRPLPRKQGAGKSGYVGVHWSTKRNKWIANITLNKHTIHLGTFDNLNDAIEARKVFDEQQELG
jgi:group I intron endonuclease